MGKEKRPFCCHQNFIPSGLSAPAQGYIHLVKYERNVKSDLKAFFFKPVTNGQSDKGFLLASKVCLQGVVCPCLGLYTCIKSFKMCLKSYFKEIVLKLATDGQSDKGFLLTSIFVPKWLSAPALGLYTCIKALKYISGPGVR